MFEGNEFVVRFAEYLLEYLEMKGMPTKTGMKGTS
jgi:hypothetical protein